MPELSYGNAAGNRLIEGDNLQVMVSLRSQYQGMVDVAYLDPPYNTGKKDFAYSDHRFHDPNADADDMVYVNNEDGGRHTKWLNYMGPRLWLTWQLLADHGICFVSINDVELFRLGMLMDEIFGERNRIGTIVWKQAVDNNPTRIAVEHEYILCYAKRIEEVQRVVDRPQPAKDWLLHDVRAAQATRPASSPQAREGLPGRDQGARRGVQSAVAEGRGRVDARRPRPHGAYRNVDERGPYARRTGTWRTREPAATSTTSSIRSPKARARSRRTGYRFPAETMRQLLAEDLIVFGKDHTQLVAAQEVPQGRRPPLRGVIDLGFARLGATLKRLFAEGRQALPTPKPVELMKQLIGLRGRRGRARARPVRGLRHDGPRRDAAERGRRRFPTFILIEEGTREDRYCRTFIAPRLKAAIQKEDLPGGFSFETTGRRLNRDAILELEREAIANLIVHTDATGKGRGITRVAGEYVIGHNARQEAICLCWNGRTRSAITRDVLVAMFDEAKARGLRRPIRAYAATCEIGETESFRFCQIPDEILAALQITDDDDAALAGDPDAVETLETALLSAADDGG